MSSPRRSSCRRRRRRARPRGRSRRSRLPPARGYEASNFSAARYTNICSLVIGCALIPRFSLTVAVGGRRELLGRAVALAPVPGSPQVVGESSGTAEAFGVVAGIGLGEALARCPELALVAPDPERADAAWEQVLVGLEGIGAAVWTERAGEAFFAIRGLRGLWGGDVEGVLEHARRAIALPARLGAGPTRLAAAAAALRPGPRRRRSDRPPSGAAIRGRFVVVPDGAARALLPPQPIALFRDPPQGGGG